jgi:hypothetical protein
LRLDIAKYKLLRFRIAGALPRYVEKIARLHSRRVRTFGSIPLILLLPIRTIYVAKIIVSIGIN